MPPTRHLPDITDLPLDDRRIAGDAIETVIDSRDYLPKDSTLLMVATRFGDDIREALELPALERTGRGPQLRPLHEMGLADLDRLDKAVETLLGRFTRYMDDPDLIAGLTDLCEKVSVILIAVKDRARREADQEARA